MRTALVPLTLVLAMAASVCVADSRDSPTHAAALDARVPRLSEAQVLRIAADEAKRQHIEVGAFSAPIVKYMPGTSGGRWAVEYGNLPGQNIDHCFSVFVDDVTKAAVLYGCG
jgi:hypothetical protein